MFLYIDVFLDKCQNRLSRNVLSLIRLMAKFHSIDRAYVNSTNQNVLNMITWLEGSDCNRHGLSSKLSRTILLCLWERLYDINFTTLRH